MSLPKKLAVFALLAAIPYAAQGTDVLAEPDIEINVEPGFNMEVVLQHTNKGFLDANENFDPLLERDVTLTKDEILKEDENGYSYANEENEDKEFVCDCQHDDQDHANDDDYEADYGTVDVESEPEEAQDNNVQANIHDVDDEKIEYAAVFIDNEEENTDHQDKKIEYDGIFIDNEEEDAKPNDEDKEIEECDCQDDDQGHADNDTDDYEADYGQVVVESADDDVQDDNKMDNFLSPDGDEDEVQDCDCEDDKSDADDEDYDADLDEIFVESGVEADKDEREEEERKKNLRAAFLAEKYDEVEKPSEDRGEDLMVVVTYDQIMATMSQEEREIEEKTGEPFYKRMYDLVVGKETQKELEATHILNRDGERETKPKFYYDGL